MNNKPLKGKLAEAPEGQGQGSFISRTTHAMQQSIKKSEKPESTVIPFLPSAASKPVTPEQKRVLYADIDRAEILIRPDGLIYLPWYWYANRLNEAFGQGLWVLVPDGDAQLKGELIVWKFHLIVDNRYMGVAYGECTYQISNRTMSYGDAIEGAKSNALMRLCKGLGMSLCLWDSEFGKEWKKEFAETYQGATRSGSKTLWRKKGEKDVDTLEEINSLMDKLYGDNRDEETTKKLLISLTGFKLAQDKYKGGFDNFKTKVNGNPVEDKDLVALWKKLTQLMEEKE